MTNRKFKLHMSRLAIREMLECYVFIGPWLIGFLLFIAGPIVTTFGFSFQDMDTVSGPATYIGFDNYVRMFTQDRLFWTCLYNTVYFVFFVVPIGVMSGLTLAVLLNQKVPAISVYRTIYYLPVVIPAVSSALLWMWIFNGQYGLLNQVLRLLYLPAPAWLADPTWSKPAFIIMSVWGSIGSPMVIYLAGLQGIPTELYEASEIDGATRWAKFRHITIPMLSPVIFFNLIISVIGSFQIFTASYIMTGGGPLDSTRFYMIYLFQQAFGYFRMGYASAMAWVLFVIILIVTILQFRFLGVRVYYESDTKR